MKTLGLDYFHAFEDDLERLSRYIEFSRDNFATYSLELVRLLLATGSEIDVALKALCRHIDSAKAPKSIVAWQKIVVPRFPDITSQEVRISRFGLTLMPWSGWEKESPKWWRAYNDVKHERTMHYTQGNLEHVLNAVAGLGVIMQYLGNRSSENFRGYFFSNVRFRGVSWNE